MNDEEGGILRGKVVVINWHAYIRRSMSESYYPQESTFNSYTTNPITVFFPFLSLIHTSKQFPRAFVVTLCKESLGFSLPHLSHVPIHVSILFKNG